MRRIDVLGVKSERCIVGLLGRLTRDDLDWAIRRAFRPEVRAAARALLTKLDRMPANMPARPAVSTTSAAGELRYGPQVISASSYLYGQE